MRTLKLRSISKKIPLFLFPHIHTQNHQFSNSSSNISLFQPQIKNPSLIPYNLKYPSPDSHTIASSFRNWFRTSKNPLFDSIYQKLSCHNENDLNRVDLGLIHRLDEKLVLEILDYKKDDALSCLKFFDWAGKQPGFNHTRVTFIAIFKILSRKKLTSLMLDFLDTPSKNHYVKKIRFNDMLVVCYALAGKVDVALQVLGRMRFAGVDLDGVSYNVLLNVLVKEGCFDAAKGVLEQIRGRGFENKVTHAIVMKYFCKQDRVKEAEEYLRELLSRGGEVCGHMVGVLVDALCKKSRFLRAGQLIHELGDQKSVPMGEPYGVWIRNLARFGKLDAAMEFFITKKSLEGYVPEVYRYNFLIHRLLKEDRLQEVCDLLMDMKENRIVPDRSTMNAVLCLFCKAGMIDVALELYRSNSEFGFTPHSLVYNYIINTLCDDDNTDKAYEMLKGLMTQGYFPGSKTFSILADALCREGKLDKMRDLVMFALESKFMPSDATYEKFVRALCRARRVEDGYLIYGELNQLNKKTSESTFVYLIRGFTEASRGDLAARLLIEMQEKGYKPTRKLFKSVVACLGEMEEKHFLQLLEMQLCRYGHDMDTYSYFIFGAGRARKPELARAVYEMMDKYGIIPSIHSDIFMLQCYLHSDRIADALNFFDDIRKRKKLGRKLYNSMVTGLCRVGKADFASAILREARDNGVVPSLQCYEELIKLSCSDSKFDEAFRLIRDLEKTGRKISSFIGNVLLLYSLHSGDLYKAWLRLGDVAKEMPCGSMLGELLDVFSRRIADDYEVEDLEDLIRKCFPLDMYTYNMLLRKLSMDRVDRACKLFKRLCQKGIKPNRWTYDILVHGLYKHGRIAEGDIWVEEMHRRGYVSIEST